MSVGVPFDFNWVIMNFNLFFMADIKPIFPLFIIILYLDRCCYQGDCVQIL